MTDVVALAPQRRANPLIVALKIAITVGVTAFLVIHANWQGMGTRIAHAGWGWLSLGLLGKVLSVVFAAGRWREAMTAADRAITFGASWRIMMISLFFGQALPGTVGSDVVRGWLTHRQGCDADRVIIALILDRLLALVACLVLIVLSLPHLTAGLAGIAALLLALIAAGIVALLLIDRLPLPNHAVIQRIHGYVHLLRTVIGSPRAMRGLGYAFAVHLAMTGAAFAFAASLNLKTSLLDFLVVVPTAILASALPLSINGWGAREGTFVAGLALFGISPAEALTVSFMMGVSDLVVVLPGGLLWLTDKAREKISAAIKRPH